MDILAELRKVQSLRGDTYSSAEVLGMIGRAADKIERLREHLKYFCDRVEAGETRSEKTYRRFKSELEK